MPHPSNRLPKNPYFISGNVTATLTSGFFHSVTCLLDADASGIAIKGGGIFVYLAEDGSDGASHLDTDGTTLGAAHDAGWYELMSSTAVTIKIPAGASIYGRFTELDSAANDQYIAYK